MTRLNIRQNVLMENIQIAEKLHTLFEKEGIFCVNLIGSPGSGKTTLLEKTIRHFKDNVETLAIVGDVQTENDAERLKATGARAVQIQTMGACHLDARMIQKEIAKQELKGLRLLFIENVGNLVCPASYYLGEDATIVILSAPEGDEKPLKYPAVFHKANLFIMTKMDMLEMCSFDPDQASKNARKINPRIEILKLSAKTGEEMEGWFEWLEKRISMKSSN